ncbi:MAG: helix-turn-helix transcriptional regulator [Pseudomonadota bacterium]
MKSPLILLLLIFQVLCAGFFLADLMSAYLGYRPLAWQVHELVEIAAALGLLAAVALTAQILIQSRRRTERAEEALRLASGALQEVIEERFDTWALTPAERDVALFVIKGLPTAEVARLRETSEGTVKAQTNAIYRKSGVSSRAQLVSLFLEDLMGEGLV